MTEQFKAGEKVAVLERGRWRIHTVAKVHKNGNFSLDGERRQFRQSGHPATHDHWDDPQVFKLTDEVRRKIHVHRLGDKIHKHIDRIRVLYMTAQARADVETLTMLDKELSRIRELLDAKEPAP